MAGRKDIYKDAVPFKKGQSGNPNGRPKGARGLSTILREMLDEDIKVIENGVEVRKQFKDVIVRKLLKKANDGDLRAIEQIFDRLEGKPKQEIEQTTIKRVIDWGIDANDKDESTSESAAGDSEQEAV